MGLCSDRSCTRSAWGPSRLPGASARAARPGQAEEAEAEEQARTGLRHGVLRRSAVGLDEETYRQIHVTFPVKLVSEWLNVNKGNDIAFHYISGGGVNADSRMMWAREKARAETKLRDLAQGTNVRVISYRPAFVTPTEAEANIGHKVLNAILAPINGAVMAESIGQAMLEIGARGPQIENGTILENKDIVGFSKAYQARLRVDTSSNLSSNRAAD